MNENDFCYPKSMYGISKKSCEEYVQNLCAKNHIQWTILRLFNVYGPGQNINRSDQGIVGIFISLIKKKPIIEITGSLDRFKDLIYIDDVVDAFILSLNKKANNQIFNVGTGKKVTIASLLKNINNIFEPHNKKVIKVLSEPHGEIKGAYADIKKIKNALGFAPKTNIDDGLIKFKKYLKF
jgi:UDP-glucose 4-epimerase